MKTRWILVLAVLALVLTSVLVACSGAKEEAAPAGSDASSAGEPAGEEGKALVEERCTKCHDLTRVEAAKKTSDEWKVTVERMVGIGAELNEEEQAAVIDYLAETYK